MDEDLADYVAVGAREDLDRLLAEYRLGAAEVGDRIRQRQPARWASGYVPPPEFLVHVSVLRPHGPFGCAGDEEALAFCGAVVDAMVARYGLDRGAAVDRLNRHWSGTGVWRYFPIRSTCCAAVRCM
ncbi:hypothetical protein [Actinoplanes sp. NPDC049802]|uniref:hypothetical protein n=1 Tax=Actinoplanes sp. NPDC049802 TaxID=3154742 RepID=UPI0033EAE7B1